MLNYKVEGVGDTLLLIHGFGISFPIWEHLLPGLIVNYRVISIELPGIGNSSLESSKNENYYKHSAKKIISLLKTLKIDTFHVLAYSLGSRVAEELIIKIPNSVNKIIFLYPTYLSKHRLVLLKSLRMIDTSVPYLGDKILQGFNLYLLIYKLGFNYKNTLEVSEWYKHISKNNINVLKKTLFDIIELEDRRNILSPEKFTTIWGKIDLIVGRPKFNQGDIILPGGHSGPVSNPIKIIEHVNSFI